MNPVDVLWYKKHVMRVLATIVLAGALITMSGRSQFAQRVCVGERPVIHNHAWSIAMLLQQSARELQGDGLIRSGLQADADDPGLAVDNSL